MPPTEPPISDIVAVTAAIAHLGPSILSEVVTHTQLGREATQRTLAYLIDRGLVVRDEIKTAQHAKGVRTYELRSQTVEALAERVGARE